MYCTLLVRNNNIFGGFVMKQHNKTRTLVQLALLTALILLLANLPYVGYIKLPFLGVQATTIHIPVIVGSLLLGPKYGAFLGFVFGLTSFIDNTVQPGLTAFCFSPFISMGEGLGGSPLALVVCFLPRILVGVVPYFVSKGIRKLTKQKAPSVSYLVGGVAGSLTNTILVMGMIYLFFGTAYAAAKAVAYEAVLGIVLSVVLINGTTEAVVAGIIATGVCSALHHAHVIKE